MKRIQQTLTLAALIAAVSFGSGRGTAQEQPPGDQPQRRQRGNGGGPGGGGNFDPEAMRQRMMERYREQLEVKDDAEWKLISERIEKVTTARREASSGGGFGGFGRGGGGPGGGGGGGGRRGGFGADPLPEAEALQKAIDGKASNDELKTKMAKLREAKKVKEANLEKAQEELRKLLSVRQEAIAMANGLLR